MFDPAQVRRILLVKLDHLGDVLLGFPAIERLHELFPDAKITALVGSWARSLVESHSCIDRVLTYDFFEANSSKVHKRLTEEEQQRIRDWLTPLDFDLAIDFRREPETRKFLLWSGALHTAGFANGPESEWLTVALPYELNVKQQRPRRHISQELMLLVEMIGIAGRQNLRPQIRAADPDLAYSEDLFRSLLPAASCLRVAIHPGSGRPIKCWPAGHFAQLADRLCDRLGACVVFFGASGEVPLVERVLAQMQFAEQAVSVAGRLTIGQILAAFPKFDLYIGNDSGPTHLAAAQGLPTLCICSGTNDPIQWAPLGPAALTIQQRVSCSPCYLRHREECPYGVSCLEELAVEDVWEAVLKVMPADPRSHPQRYLLPRTQLTYMTT
jgi:ADP-heptose:LPS heptosyltransferase